jgi:hypothetical protein
MKQEPDSRRSRSSAKSILRLPNLEHAKAAALNSLTSRGAQRGYRYAVDEWVDWYCSEPRLAFNTLPLSSLNPLNSRPAHLPMQGTVGDILPRR